MKPEHFAHLARQLENSAYVEVGMARGDNHDLDAALARAVVEEAPPVDVDSLPIRETVWIDGEHSLDIRDGGGFVAITADSDALWCAYRAADLETLPSVTDFQMQLICRRCRTPHTINAGHVVTRPCACGRHFKGMRLTRPPTPAARLQVIK